MSGRIDQVVVDVLRLPLTRPYCLSFVVLDAFTAVTARIVFDSGAETLGEVVPLPGYSDETVADVLAAARPLAAELRGLDAGAARQLAGSLLPQAPCAASLFLSGLDLMHCADDDDWAIPLVYPVSSADPELAPSVQRGLAAGYRTIKVKIGAEIEQDVQSLATLRNAAVEGCRFRFDANQAYTPQSARRFLAAVEERLAPWTELVEQPLPPDAWSDFAALARATSVPLMLDESIRTLDDIPRAKDAGARWVKLKLCKQGGARELVRAAELARSLQLEVVLGNGVATDVANLLELSVQARHPDLFRGASESNGFAKLVTPLRYSRLRVEGGCAVCRPRAGSAPAHGSGSAQVPV